MYNAKEKKKEGKNFFAFVKLHNKVQIVPIVVALVLELPGVADRPISNKTCLFVNITSI